LSSGAAPTAFNPEAPSSQGTTLARNALFLLLGQIGSTTLSLILSVVLARTLGATDFGIYFLLLQTSLFAYVFVEWGQSAYLVREAAQRPQATSVLLGSALVFRVLAGLLAVGLTSFMVRLLGYDARLQGLAALMVLCQLPVALSQPYSYLFRSRDRMDLDAIVTVVTKGLIVAATIPALLLGGRLIAVILALGLGGLGALATGFVLARRVGLPPARVTREGLHELAVGGGSIAMFLVAIAAQPFLDVVVLSKLAPASAVGWYGAARNIMGLLTAPATILASASFPQMCRAAFDIPQLRQAVRPTLQLLVGLGSLGAVGTYLFAEFAVSFLSLEKFGPSVSILQLFAPTILLLFVDMLFGSMVTAVGRARALAIAKVLSVVVSTGLAVVLVPLLQERYGNGGLGIVAAFGISEFVMLAAYLAMLPRGVLDRTTLVDLGRAILAGAVTFVVMSAALPFVGPWIALPSCIAVFSLVAWAVGLANPAAIAQAALPMRAR